MGTCGAVFFALVAVFSFAPDFLVCGWNFRNALRQTCLPQDVLGMLGSPQIPDGNAHEALRNRMPGRHPASLLRKPSGCFNENSGPIPAAWLAFDFPNRPKRLDRFL